MIDHIGNRDRIVEALHREVVGPDECGPEISFSESEVYEDGPVCQKRSEEDLRAGTRPQEILRGEAPHYRYGAGVLHPRSRDIQAEDRDQPDIELGYEQEEPEDEIETEGGGRGAEYQERQACERHEHRAGACDGRSNRHRISR